MGKCVKNCGVGYREVTNQVYMEMRAKGTKSFIWGHAWCVQGMDR